MIALALAGCPKPETPPDDTDDTVPTGDTGATHSATPTTTDPDARFLRCALDANNSLRGRCAVTWQAEGPVRLTFSAPGEVDREFVSDGVALDHDLAFWGLPQQITWLVTAANADTGEVLDVSLRTRQLPDTFPGFGFQTTGAQSSDLSAFLVAASCPAGTLVVADTLGRIVWYEHLVEGPMFSGSVSAVSLTDRGTVLAIVGRDTVVELAFDGTKLRVFESGPDFDDFVHHDVIGHGGYTFALAARAIRVDGRDWVVDSLLAFDDAGLVASADFAGRFPYDAQDWMREGYWSGAFPGSVDLSHANSLFREDTGALWISFRHQFAFARVDGDPTSLGFGTFDLLAVGDPSSPSFGDATVDVVGGPHAPFTGQHDVHPAADGSVLLLDNGWPQDRDPLASRYTLDEVAGTLTLAEEWEVGDGCPTQGAVRELPSGNVVTTCASEARVLEYAPGRSTPVFSATATCLLAPAVFAEAVPVDLPLAPAR